jgi:carboxypeptidase D
LASFTFAQFPPQPEGVTTKQLQHIPGASISYKETSICETSAKAWAGYVHLPSSVLADIETDEPYNISMFFWYFEAREDPRNAPTTIYLAGGPGEPGVSGALSDGGPCTVNPNSNSTTNNPYSWNTYVNMLYIDQPVSTGFSYTKQVKSTLNLMFLGDPLTETGITPFEAYDGAVPPQNTTFNYGVFSEQNPQKTANSTVTAAKTIWHFSQAWFSSFPEYNTCKKEVIIFGNSYGGFYVPVTAGYFVEQNAKIAMGQLDGTVIPIDTVGWTNGCTDLLVQGEWYPDQAYNNTYGLEVVPKDIYEEMKHNFTKPGGCRDQIELCRELGDKYDPEQLNTNATVNKVCVTATEYCYGYVAGAYGALSNRSVFDMAHLDPDPWPTVHWYGYLTQEWVLKDLGVPVNFSSYSLLDNNPFFYTTGDPMRTNGRKPMEYLLDQGVKVAMIYGDRDYRCPWNGAEKLSLAAAWSGAEDFGKAGYEYVQTNASYQGGVVRQYGNFSFTRVFEAGHDGE